MLTALHELCVFDIKLLVYPFQELDELHSQRRDLKANFTKEKNDYYAAIREIKTQKHQEWSAKGKNERPAMFKAVLVFKLVTLSMP